LTVFTMLQQATTIEQLIAALERSRCTMDDPLEVALAYLAALRRIRLGDAKEERGAA
jgi:hypothetical protein